MKSTVTRCPTLFERILIIILVTEKQQGIKKATANSQAMLISGRSKDKTKKSKKLKEKQ